jgi:hypothetical protein
LARIVPHHGREDRLNNPKLLLVIALIRQIVPHPFRREFGFLYENLKAGQVVLSPSPDCSSEPLADYRDSLTAPDASGGQTVASISPLKLA